MERHVSYEYSNTVFLMFFKIIRDNRTVGKTDYNIFFLIYIFLNPVLKYFCTLVHYSTLSIINTMSLSICCPVCKINELLDHFNEISHFQRKWAKNELFCPILTTKVQVSQITVTNIGILLLFKRRLEYRLELNFPLGRVKVTP